MSHSVPERLRDLETDVRDLEVLPAAAVRARGRSRGRRQMAVVTAAGAVVIAAAGVTLVWPHQQAAPTTSGPTVSAGLDCVLDLPSSPAEIRIRVLDGGAPAGLADTAAAQLRARDFTVRDGTSAGQDPAGATTLRYGPAAIGAATVLRAAVYGEVVMRFDPERRDETIDLTLGPAFNRLATTTEMNQKLVELGEPTAPPQCR